MNALMHSFNLLITAYTDSGQNQKAGHLMPICKGQSSKVVHDSLVMQRSSVAIEVAVRGKGHLFQRDPL